jgi:putative DNA primase/helicase
MSRRSKAAAEPANGTTGPPPDPALVQHQIARMMDNDAPFVDRFRASTWLAQHHIDVELPPEDPVEAKSWSTSEAVARGFATSDGPACGRLILQRLSEIEAAPVDWLWPDRIPLGMLSLLYGDGGVGKSMLLLSIAATVTCARDWPDQPGVSPGPGSVILIQAEDSLRHTVRPRFDATNGDASRIHIVKGVMTNKLRSSFSIRAHIDAIRAEVEERGDVKLIIVDPISAFIGGADDNRNAEVRDVLGPLGELAEEYHFAVIMNHHSNKGSGTKALYRASGAAYANVARIAWFVGGDPDKAGRTFMAPVKCNIGPMPSAMAFEVSGQAVRFEPKPLLGLHANMILMRERTLLAEDTDCVRDGKRGRLPRKLKACIQRLVEYLTDGPKAQRDALAIVKAAGFSTGTFYDSVNRGPFERIQAETFKESTMLRLKDHLPLDFDDDETVGE